MNKEKIDDYIEIYLLQAISRMNKIQYITEKIIWNQLQDLGLMEPTNNNDPEYQNERYLKLTEHGEYVARFLSEMKA